MNYEIISNRLASRDSVLLLLVTKRNVKARVYMFKQVIFYYLKFNWLLLLLMAHNYGTLYTYLIGLHNTYCTICITVCELLCRPGKDKGCSIGQCGKI